MEAGATTLQTARKEQILSATADQRQVRLFQGNDEELEVDSWRGHAASALS
jgi:hypothetical protein